jgi:enoyl-CoA hydratase
MDTSAPADTSAGSASAAGSERTSAADAAAPLRIERRNGIAWLIFNRPTFGNAMNAEMMAMLPDAWRELDADPDVRAIVVTGEGKAFQTGLDVVELSRNPDALRAISRQTKRADLQLTGWHLKVTKPIVTAVNGVCAGGGLHFVADSDIVIAASTATFLDPHVSVGQVSGFETIGLARRGSFGDVARMAFTGAHERVSARRAYELGWLSAVIEPPDQLRATAQQLAEGIAGNDPAAMAATKRMLWSSLESGLRMAREAALREATVPAGTTTEVPR